MGDEVSSRACVLVLQFAEERGISRSQLLRGLPVSMDHLQRRRSRISWSTFTTIVRRVADQLGGNEALEEAGRLHGRAPVVPWFGAVARTVLSAKDFYRIGATYGNSIFRNVPCRFEVLSQRKVRQTLTIAPGYEDCPEFFHLMKGGMRFASQQVGMPPAHVVLERRPRTGIFTIHLPPSLTLRTRLMRRLGSSRGALQEMVEELSLQHRDLLDAYEELSSTHDALQTEIRVRERAETQLHRSQRMEAIGRLAAGIAHDFNNHLTAITGYAEIAERRSDTPASLRDDLANIRRAADRATDLTRNLLAFSRRQVAKPVVLDLNEVIYGLEGMLRTLVGERIEFTLHTDPGLYRVTADRSQLEQVILNLVLNARDAISDDGALRLETSNRQVSDDGDSPQGLVPGDWVELVVADTGCGIEAAARERIFEPFFTTKTTGEATGLGLAIVYGVVQQCGGHVDVESEPGLGTTFSIHLPGITATAAETISSRQVVGDRVETETVLLVEEDPMVRGLARRVLQEAGYRVLEATNTGSALEISARTPHRIDLLVADLSVARTKAETLARTLRQRDPRLAVLYVVADSDPQLPTRLGAREAYLSKPFSAATLTARVRELLATSPN